MRKLLRQLLDAVAAGRDVTYCRLVETRGSTPQKPGAAMLVFADGSQAGTLGGGCVEAEVKRRALGILAQGRPEIVGFQLDNDYGWDDGLICGGRMQVLVRPVTAGTPTFYFERLCDLITRGEGCIEAIVFDAEKNGLEAASCYLFDGQGQMLAKDGATRNNSTTAESLQADLPNLANRPRPSAIRGVAYLPSLPRCRLLIVGGGHIGQAVGNMAVDLDFDVWIVDDRAEYVSRERFPRAERLFHGEIGPLLREMEIMSNTYCLIVTRGHNHDEEALFHLVDRGARYVGMIGSRRKIKLIFDDLEAEGIPAEAIAKVYAPVGIEIGSQTVPEIAVSILAELVSHRNLGGEVPGRPAPLIAAE